MANLRHIAFISPEPQKLYDYYHHLYGMEKVRVSPAGSIHVIDGLFNLAFLAQQAVVLDAVDTHREDGHEIDQTPGIAHFGFTVDRLEDVLCPKFDVGFTALVEDLDTRGLLDETLVVAIAEFGRTPKINALGGRDHWGPVFSFALAGAGISPGQVYGASDRHGAYPARNRVTPADLTATIFHLLGISHHAEFKDQLGRPLPIVEGGNPIKEIVGG